MSGNDDGVSPEMVRELARLELDSITPLRNLLIDEHSASFRWLMASLMAINAGGLIALKDARLASGWTIVSGSAFFLGVGFALLIALLGQKSNRAMMEPVSAIGLALTQAIVTGVYDLESIQNQQTKIQEVTGKGWKAQAAGWLSFMLFSVGAVSLIIQCYQTTDATGQDAQIVRQVR